MAVYLPELSVSHYLLVRGLEKAGLQEKTSKWSIPRMRISSRLLAPAAYARRWHGIHSFRLSKTPQTTEVFSSSQVPGELIDMMVVNTQTLKDNPELGKALTGAWFEMMAKMQAGDTQALSAMAADSGTDLAGYRAQLKQPISSGRLPIP